MYKLYWSTPYFADLSRGASESNLLWSFKKFVEESKPFDTTSLYSSLFEDPNNVLTFFLGRKKGVGVTLISFLKENVSELEVIIQKNSFEKDVAFGAANLKQLKQIGFCRCITDVERKIKAQHLNMEEALSLGIATHI